MNVSQLLEQIKVSLSVGAIKETDKVVFIDYDGKNPRKLHIVNSIGVPSLSIEDPDSYPDLVGNIGFVDLK